MTQPSSPHSPELQRELETHLDTLRELGPQYTDTVAASLMERIDRMVDAKIEARLSRMPVDRSSNAREQTRMLAVTMGIGIPLTAIAGGIAGLPGIIVVWLALIAIIFLPKPR